MEYFNFINLFLLVVFNNIYKFEVFFKKFVDFLILDNYFCPILRIPEKCLKNIDVFEFTS
jgi:hypothetical protein